MSLSGAPSKAEVMGWGPVNLANYMGKLKLSGCDKYVLKQRISGAWFMEMSVNDLQAFPSLYVPLVAKIQSEINKGDQKKAIGDLSEASKNPKKAVVQEQDDWASDESDDGGDNDYEDGGEGGYICAVTEPQDNEDTYEVAIKTFPSADTRKAPQRPREVTLQDGLCRGDTKQPKYIRFSPCLARHVPNIHKTIKTLVSVWASRFCSRGGPCWEDQETSTALSPEEEAAAPEAFQTTR
uniref:lymphocyte cytosolic protein 2-like n=1 Tax=Gasterosteus aculeatus aculeatus TaxID=481459 RepID=UPI001A991DAA|nr:lymphocyte cytosolic protein 2-like [Gasterosteus aculeatus aculeatus]